MSETKEYTDFQCHELDELHVFYTGTLPDQLRLEQQQFEEIWQLHPDTYHRIKVHGREARTPRWQQAYGADYHYTGNVNKALPVPPLIEPLLAWTRQAIDQRLNGVLLNWYDADRRHYIGKHRDSTINMIEGVPIVTISFGQERPFRLRPWKADGFRDFAAQDSRVFIMPYDTNLAWTHEVPYSTKQTGRRISVTVRGFESTSI